MREDRGGSPPPDPGDDARLPDGLADWMIRQRWFAGKGGTARLRVQHVLPLTGADRPIRILLVADGGGPAAPVYQVPVIESTRPVDGDRRIAVDGGRAFVDAVPEIDFARAVIAAVAGDHATAADVVGTRALTAEQSNSSVVVARTGAPDLMLKVLRTVRHGENPDAEVARALAALGSTHVPAYFGALDAEWPDGAGGTAAGHLAVLQEFVPDAADAWALATRSAASGADFSAQAAEIGSATAGLHASLASAFGTIPATADRVDDLCRLWEARLTAAVRDAPSLAERAPAIRAVQLAAREGAWPPLQRIHGDLHLGQILRAQTGSSTGRWLFVDFEGEPLRALAERVEPEPALRDVAGMLRSFDYAAATSRRDEWAAPCRGAFLDAYRRAAGTHLDPALLRALELDKAVYEASYEARNRPAWLPIPLAAIDRMLAAGDETP
jgi:predicted trehalose synthase